MAFLTLRAQLNLYTMSPSQYKSILQEIDAQPQFRIRKRWWGKSHTGPIGGVKNLQIPAPELLIHKFKPFDIHLHSQHSHTTNNQPANHIHHQYILSPKNPTEPQILNFPALQSLLLHAQLNLFSPMHFRPLTTPKPCKITYPHTPSNICSSHPIPSHKT